MIESLNIKTITEALSILQNELKENNYLALIKHIFFSDRYHLRHFGFLYTADDYFAMKLGPVPSTTKDIVSVNSFLEDQIAPEDFEYLKNKIESLSGHDIRISETSEDNLSESIKESLDFTIKNFGNFSKYELADITHDYPEWKKFEYHFQKNHNQGRQPMNIIDFFDDPDKTNRPQLERYLKGIDFFEDDREFLEELKNEYKSRTIA